jgi:RNA 3'-terminal phosphate cyclase (ATP)
MIEINGEKGGGQILRTALTLSTVTGEGFRMENIRGNRSDPGMKRQHLECVKAVQRLCDGETKGVELESEEMVFRPGELRNCSFTSNIGTAGSVNLMFDSVLPVTTQFSESFRLRAKGGTDVKWSPSFAYFKHVKLPLLNELGLNTVVELESTGYYPKGGGEATLNTEEFSLNPISLENRGKLKGFEIFSKASSELEGAEVAERQADETARILKEDHVSVSVQKNVNYEDTASTGSSLLVKAVYENSIAGFDMLGEKGKRSEDVAREAVESFQKFHSSDAAVDKYMADQLMVFIAIAGGAISIPEVTDHVQTNLEIINSFRLGLELEGQSGRKKVVKT